MVEISEQRRKKVKRETFDDNVLTDILSRLSVKCISSFKTVCKSWNSLSRDKFFVKKHLSRSRENPTFITCPSMDMEMKLYSMRPDSFEVSTLNPIRPAERSPENYMYMISSFNGLICCINYISDEEVENGYCDLQIWICNPCTGESLLIPQGKPSLEVEPRVGVAYASDVSDYKIFRIYCVGKKPKKKVPMFIEYSYDLIYECEVYSSNTGYWENIGPAPRAPMRFFGSPFNSSHAFVDGNIFWIASLNDKGEILSVDLEGKFKIISLPPYPDDLKEEDAITEATYLINLQGLLSVVILHTDSMDVWVWKKDGEDSWEFVCEDEIPFDYLEIVVAMSSLQNQIVCATETDWWTYNVDTSVWKSEMGPPSGFVNPSIFPFTESVLTCNGGVML